MKTTQIQHLLFLLPFLFLVACTTGGGDSMAGKVAEDSLAALAADSMVNADTMDQSPVVEDQSLVESKTEASKEQLEKSQMAAVPCCENIDPVKDCCCKEVLESYEEYLKKEDYDALERLVLEEVFYGACANQKKDFENRVEALEIAYEQ